MKGKRGHFRLIIFLGLITFSHTLFAAENWKAVHYEIGSHRQKVLFRSQRQDEEAGRQLKKSNIVFMDPEGKVASTEEVLFENGKISKYRMDQKQLDQWGEMEIKDGRIFFSYYKDGKKTTDDEKLPDNLIIAPTTVAYVLKHWSEILKGDTVDVRFGVLDRKETVGFKFFKVNEDKIDGKDVVVVKMKPTSIIIAAIVDPLLFTFNREGTKLLELKGRTLPKQKVDGKWKDLDVDSVYLD